ncbi:MAG: hypothetical protein QM775_10250 [Pirellulales bacterium]
MEISLAMTREMEARVPKEIEPPAVVIESAVVTPHDAFSFGAIVGYQ